MIITEGIVLKERFSGEHDKFIDILTKDRGIIEICVKGARKINGKSGSSAQLFAYSKFCIDLRKNMYFLNSAEPIHIFYGLRNSLAALSLASYFSDILRYCIQEKSDGENIIRLFLNTLHFLEKGLRSEKQLKAIFELRLMSETGFMPDVLVCRKCGTFEPQELYFNVPDGSFVCKDCFSGEYNNFFSVKLPVLSAVRHIVLTDFDRLFNFRVSEETLEILSEFAEAYIQAHTERSFNTLDFYKSLKGK
ncbi:MAG: DNA repair protein RecO [Ruminococcus sp.]|nr:DNA repair protein RecO [Ruminococcus sp.]